MEEKNSDQGNQYDPHSRPDRIRDGDTYIFQSQSKKTKAADIKQQ